MENIKIENIYGNIKITIQKQNNDVILGISETISKEGAKILIKELKKAIEITKLYDEDEFPF